MHIHLIGIAGSAMASLAGLLVERGHRVTGSDHGVYPPMSTLLESLGIDYADSYTASNLRPTPDLVVVGNAISRGNEELESVLDRRIPYTSSALLLKEEFLQGKHVVAIAGTHGKTTTTSLVAWLLESAGLEPSFLIGGISENFATSFRLTDSEFFVLEADEYDTAYFDKGPKMWHYLPHTAVVTNIEFDHADIYRDDIAYRFAFARFINLVPRTGTLVAGWETEAVRTLSAVSPAPVESFAFTAEEASTVARWQASAVEFAPGATRFDVIHDDQVLGSVETPLSGAFNVRNALAAIAAATAAGADFASIRRGLTTFQSVRRRMEVRGEVGGVTVIDDFAHHPTAVRETIAAVRQSYAGRRIIAVFEPRSYTAQLREMQEPYGVALKEADRVVLAGLFRPERYDASTGLDPHQLARSLREQGTLAEYLPDVDDIVRDLASTVRSGDVVLIMSNGGFGGIHVKLLASLPR